MASIPTQEEVVAATRKSQEAMVAAVKTWLETVRTAAPKLPSKLPQVSLPFADKLPTPQDAVANAYHLAEQLLASQRRFAEDLVKATAPLRPGYRESSPEVPSPSAWQDAVTDSEPKTPAVTAAAKAADSTAPARPAAKAADSTAPARPAAKAADSTAPARPAAKSTPARTAPRTTAAKRTTTGSASTTTTRATGTGTRKSTTASSADSAGKSAGTTTPAPKGTDAS
jgi:hypothetical protein